MAFGARQEDGKWRICLRKGATCIHQYPGGPEIEFASQRRAKACADELNEEFWPRYSKNKELFPVWAMDMIETIRKHCN